MSIKAIQWVFDNSEAEGVTRLVHISLANYADASGRCWPGQARLVKETNSSPMSVSRAINWLKENGYLVIEAQGGFRGEVHDVTGQRKRATTNHYRLINRPRTVTPEWCEGDTNMVEGSHQDGGTVTSEWCEGDTNMVDNPLENHQDEPSENLSSRVDGSADNDAEKKERKPRTRKMVDYCDDFEAVWKVYPRHQDKKWTYSVWQARVDEKVPVQELYDATVAYAAFCAKERRAKNMIMQPATFFGPNERWLDWVTGVAQQEASGKADNIDTVRTGEVIEVEF